MGSMQGRRGGGGNGGKTIEMWWLCGGKTTEVWWLWWRENNRSVVAVLEGKQ